MTDPHVADDLPLLEIGHGDVRAVFAPTRGGRMLSLRLGDEELLWQNPALVGPDLQPVLPVGEWPRGDGGMDTWANVGGSKTWPAPQGWDGPDEWAGPPDPVLDAGSWEVVEHTPAAISMRSASDPRTGLRLTRTFVVDADGLDERITMTNVGDRVSHWAPWEVAQVRTDDGGTVLVLGAASDDRVDLGTWEGSVDERPTDAGIELQVGTGVGKRGYRNADAVRYRRASGTSITIGTVQTPGPEDDAAPFPDGGCRVELWLQRPVEAPLVELQDLRPDAHLVELEVLGRRVPLAPGATRRADVRWDLRAAG